MSVKHNVSCKVAIGSFTVFITISKKTNNAKTFHSKAKYTFFLRVHETFSRIDHILGHNRMKLELDYKRKTGKDTNM